MRCLRRRLTVVISLNKPFALKAMRSAKSSGFASSQTAKTIWAVFIPVIRQVAAATDLTASVKFHPKRETNANRNSSIFASMKKSANA